MPFIDVCNEAHGTSLAGLTRITLNRPDRHNAFNDVMIDEMIDAFRAAGSDPGCRVVLLQAYGKNFSAGADVQWMKSMAKLSHKQNKDDAERLAELMHAVYTLPKLVVAKVQGASYGGALGLISACDIAVGIQGATFCLSEVKIGLVPAVISPYVIEAIGVRNARRYMVSAESFSCEQAKEFGLLHEVMQVEEVDDWIHTLVGKVRVNGPQATAQCKKLIQDVAHKSISEATIDHTARLIADLRVSDEGQEGLSAFLQKRQASWVTGGKPS